MSKKNSLFRVLAFFVLFPFLFVAAPDSICYDSLEKPKKQDQLNIYSTDKNKGNIDSTNSVSNTYTNANQGFHLTFPPIGKWVNKISIDEKGKGDLPPFFDGIFFVSGRESSVTCLVRINLFSEVTPTTPRWPFCKQEGKAVVLWNNKVPLTIYSAYQAKTETTEKECDSSLNSSFLDEHVVDARFCLDENLRTYSPRLNKKEEYYYSCKGGDNLYNFSLYCKGENWEGEEGRNRCYRLFDDIFCTFGFTKTARNN